MCMEPFSSVELYTILYTGADADDNSFLTPKVVGGYLSRQQARLALRELITAEKEELDARYDGEEQSEDYWEMYQEGYAASLFSRLEIQRSTLFLPVENEDAREAAHVCSDELYE